jgi:hypothetical protein
MPLSRHLFLFCTRFASTTTVAALYHHICLHTPMCDFVCRQENVICHLRPMHAMYIKTKPTQTQRKDKWKTTRPASKRFKMLHLHKQSTLLKQRDLEFVDCLPTDQCCSRDFYRIENSGKDSRDRNQETISFPSICFDWRFRNMT